MTQKETAPGVDRGGEEVQSFDTASSIESNTHNQAQIGYGVSYLEIAPIERVDVDGIDVRPDHRDVDPEVVKALAESMRRVGQLSPILVREPQVDYGPVILISGRHRLEAAKLLGWNFIDACFFHISDAAARVREISENLHRAELSVLERAQQTSELIALYECLDENENKLAQVAQVSKGGRGNKGGKSKAARQLGISRREIDRAEKIASITPEAAEAAKAAGIDDNQSKLLQVAATEPEKQVEAVANIAAEKTEKPKKRDNNTANDDDSEFAPPEEIKKNILDSIARHKAVALAYKKILKSPSLDQEMKDEVSAAIDGLIKTWQSLQQRSLRRRDVASDGARTTRDLGLESEIEELKSENAELRRKTGGVA